MLIKNVARQVIPNPSEPLLDRDLQLIFQFMTESGFREELHNRAIVYKEKLNKKKDN